MTESDTLMPFGDTTVKVYLVVDFVGVTVEGRPDSYMEMGFDPSSDVIVTSIPLVKVGVSTSEPPEFSVSELPGFCLSGMSEPEGELASSFAVGAVARMILLNGSKVPNDASITANSLCLSFGSKVSALPASKFNRCSAVWFWFCKSGSAVWFWFCKSGSAVWFWFCKSGSAVWSWFCKSGSAVCVALVLVLFWFCKFWFWSCIAHAQQLHDHVFLHIAAQLHEDEELNHAPQPRRVRVPREHEEVLAARDEDG